MTLTLRHDAQLTDYFEEWKLRFQSEFDPYGLSTLFSTLGSALLTVFLHQTPFVDPDVHCFREQP